jgi:hypothetical protein
MNRILSLLLLCVCYSTQAQEWHSADTQTELVELFTSEGCSSCPPADRWLSSLKEDPGLFSKFVPVAFHVDYWDYIGWKDRFARPEYSERQREYVREGTVSQVYTPGYVVNGREWRQWLRGLLKWSDSEQQAGRLSARLIDHQLTANFEQKRSCTLYVAYLGMGLQTRVKAGENRGRNLKHDFVVLELLIIDGSEQWQVELPPVPDVGQQHTALAVWVSPDNSQQVLQALGGYLE